MTARIPRRALAGCLATLLVAGCCAAPRGRAIQLLTDPPGVAFDTSWGETGVTPCEIRLPATSQGGEIQLRHADYVDREVRIEPDGERPHKTLAFLAAFGLLLEPPSQAGEPEKLRLEPDQQELRLHLEPMDSEPGVPSGAAR